MLALSRKKGEGIVIGDDIELVVLDISKEGVKLGVRAPKNISIHRKEIYIQIQDENKAAINTSDETKEILKSMLNNKI